MAIDALLMHQLFVHRGDVYASQQPGGAYLPVERPLTVDDIAEHLGGWASYGVYTTDPAEHTVKYLVFDLDTHHDLAWKELCRLVVELVRDHTGEEQHFNWRCLLAESSGNKGKHIWLFLSEPVPARDARLWAQQYVMQPWADWVKVKEPITQVETDGHRTEHRVPVTALELFPKQDFVPDGGYGNLVKLPLGVHAVSGNRSQIIVKQGWADCLEDVSPLPANLVPKAPVSRSGGRNAPSGSGDRVTPFPCVTELLDNGVGKGNRDNAMFHLAVYLYGHGVDEDLATEMLMRTNQKFDPPMSEQEVSQRVRSAYRGRYSGAACGSGWLVDICPGPCKAGWSVGKTAKGGTLASATEGGTVDVTVRTVTKEASRIRVTVEHPDAQNTPTFVVNRSAHAR